MAGEHDNRARGEKIKPPRGSILTPLVNTGTFYPPEEWMEQHHRHLELSQQGPFDLVLLGDSILFGWAWPGRPEIWEKYFGSLKTANLAISGDYIQHLLWRIENGDIASLAPRLLILLIGANNLDEYEAVEISKGIMKILNRLKRLCPSSRILLTGLFPRGQEPDTPIRRKIITVNRYLSCLADANRISFDNPGPGLLENDGGMSRKMFYDWCHPNVEGYRRWGTSLHPLVNRLLSSD